MRRSRVLLLVLIFLVIYWLPVRQKPKQQLVDVAVGVICESNAVNAILKQSVLGHLYAFSKTPIQGLDPRIQLILTNNTNLMQLMLKHTKSQHLVLLSERTQYHTDALLWLLRGLDSGGAPCTRCYYNGWNGPGTCYGWLDYRGGVALDRRWLKDIQKPTGACQMEESVWLTGLLYKQGIRPKVIDPGFSLVIAATEDQDLWLRRHCATQFRHFQDSNVIYGQTGMISQQYHSNGFLVEKTGSCGLWHNAPYGGSKTCPPHLDAVPIQAWTSLTLSEIQSKRNHVNYPLALIPKHLQTQTVRQCQSKSDCPVEWITFATRCESRMRRFVESVQSKGFPLTVLGLDTSNWFQQDRIRYLHDYLLTLKPQKIVIWSHADNVLLLPTATIETVLERYQKLRDSSGAKIFVSAQHDTKNPILRQLFPIKDDSFSVLDDGMLVGETQYLIKLITFTYTAACMDESFAWSKALLDPIVQWKHPQTGDIMLSSSIYLERPPSAARPLLALDHSHQLLLSVNDTTIGQYDIQSTGSVIVRSTGGNPLIVKANEKYQFLLEQIRFITFTLYDS